MRAPAHRPLRRALAASWALFACVGQAAQAAPIACTVDAGGGAPSRARVEIVVAPDGTRQARVDGRVTHARVVPTEHRVRPGLAPAIPDHAAGLAPANDGETAIAWMKATMEGPDVPLAARLPFTADQVRRVTIHPLSDKPDKLGGIELIDAWGQGDRYLGRVYRHLFFAACR